MEAAKKVTTEVLLPGLKGLAWRGDKETNLGDARITKQ